MRVRTLSGSATSQMLSSVLIFETVRGVPLAGYLQPNESRLSVAAQQHWMAETPKHSIAEAPIQLSAPARS